MSRRPELSDLPILGAARERPFAHKGNTNGENKYTENSREAFIEAVLLGANLETDVVGTGPDARGRREAVVCHPSNTPEETARGDIPQNAIENMEPDDVRRIYRINGRPLLTLRELIEAIPDFDALADREVYINVDLKNLRAVDPTVRDIQETGVAERFNLASFGQRARDAAEMLGEEGIKISHSASERSVKALYAASRLGTSAPVMAFVP